MIRIEMPKTEVRVGDTLTGQVVWNAEGGKQPRKIEVAVRWIASGKGQRNETVVDQTSEADVASRSQVVIPVSLEIPFGPVTYEGKLFRIDWEVSARVDLPFAIDEKVSTPFVVRPAIWTHEQFQSFLHLDDDDDFDIEDEIDTE